jgi:hypothetical protein
VATRPERRPRDQDRRGAARGRPIFPFGIGTKAANRHHLIASSVPLIPRSPFHRFTLNHYSEDGDRHGDAQKEEGGRFGDCRGAREQLEHLRTVRRLIVECVSHPVIISGIIIGAERRQAIAEGGLIDLRGGEEPGSVSVPDSPPVEPESSTLSVSFMAIGCPLPSMISGPRIPARTPPAVVGASLPTFHVFLATWVMIVDVVWSAVDRTSTVWALLPR